MSKLVTLSAEKDFAHKRFVKSFLSPSFRIRVAPNLLTFPRFAFIIPKKIMPKVTDRNKIRRRIKAVVAKHLPHFANFDILIFPSKNSLVKTYTELSEELASDFKKLKIWKS